MDIPTLYQEFLLSSGVTIDTRILKANQIFFALPGSRVDGSQYAVDAINKGARLAIVDDAVLARQHLLCIYVPDVLATLQQLASFHRLQRNIPIIAITGSAGKTTTKELIASVLAKKYSVTYTKGNLNNHIGVPLTLLHIHKDTQIAIIEMGANHVGEIERLCEIARPSHGLITSLGKAHLEGFGSFEGVIIAKSELYRFLGNHQGTAFVNADDEKLVAVSKAFNMDKVFYSDMIKGDLLDSSHLLKISLTESLDTQVINTTLPGKFNYTNLIAAAAVGIFFKITLTEIKDCFEHFKNEANRSQLMQAGTNEYLMDAYNANPLSMTEAIHSFADFKTDKKKVLILGDMRELGEESGNEHLKIIDLIHWYSWDRVCLVGEIFFTLKAGSHFNFFEKVEDFISWESNHPLEHICVLIKGSRGVSLEKWLEKKLTSDSTH